MKPNDQAESFELEPHELDIFPGIMAGTGTNQWPYRKSNELCEMVNTRLEDLVGSVALSDIPEGPNKRKLQQEMNTRQTTLTSMREQLLPHLTDKGVTADDLDWLRQQGRSD